MSYCDELQTNLKISFQENIISFLDIQIVIILSDLIRYRDMGRPLFEKKKKNHFNERDHAHLFIINHIVGHKISS